MAGDEFDNFSVSGAYCQEFAIRDGLAMFIDDGHVMGVGVGIDAGDDDIRVGSQGRNCPSFKRWLTGGMQVRWADKTVTGLRDSGSYEVMSA
ncbi:hypothetical protein [Arthrobacter sp. efr-133-TYG-118]|uniref:hypothetical protein n=1 Tax=Arthrobacter sp. efr-133-TYG-118 TaxID=3040279 RepID=UPI00254FE1DC|nr:hypothetical protein [Arthrobacter sp. efr-133-TYG-118]